MAVVFVPLPDTFRCELIYAQNGQTLENVIHVKTGGGLLEADANRIAAKLAGWFDVSLQPNITSSCSLQRIEVVDASQQDAVGIIYTTGLPLAGTAEASALPNNVTVAIKWSTGLTGRSFRGRSFLCGIRPTGVTGNQLLGAYQTALADAHNALITALAAGGTSDILVVGSKRHNLAWRETGVVTPVTNASVDINTDSQRRRLTGTGRGV